LSLRENFAVLSMGNFLQVLASFVLLLGQLPTSIDKKEFYEVVSNTKEKTISHYLEVLNTATFKEKEAYVGALLMRKAGIVGGPKQKLSLFKEGAKKLESEIKKDKGNPEYRFLRLMIQENAPGILGYKDNLDDDKTFLLTNYSFLEPIVQKAVLDYSKSSKILHTNDFQH